MSTRKPYTKPRVTARAAEQVVCTITISETAPSPSCDAVAALLYAVPRAWPGCVMRGSWPGTMEFVADYAACERRIDEARQELAGQLTLDTEDAT